ncbi:hypothetical protein FF38_01187 [Lucilia cuprina]|uniref:Uncharacterized protein n=1 Tax=Lucilia cuprina TaxID=7375 RepID=A0A0L0C8K5_LUCCU|nr:hypothetical protein FF38_01187 [Lucilia cuprina]
MRKCNRNAQIPVGSELEEVNLANEKRIKKNLRILLLKKKLTELLLKRRWKCQEQILFWQAHLPVHNHSSAYEEEPKQGPTVSEDFRDCIFAASLSRYGCHDLLFFIHVLKALRVLLRSLDSSEFHHKGMLFLAFVIGHETSKGLPKTLLKFSSIISRPTIETATTGIFLSLCLKI